MNEHEKHCKNQMQTGNFSRALGKAKGMKGAKASAPRIEEKSIPSPSRYEEHR